MQQLPPIQAELGNSKKQLCLEIVENIETTPKNSVCV